jgi:predicted 3-demethylubiquinone-9 3-methyltransferase (glyoxalase superfamily)
LSSSAPGGVKPATRAWLGGGPQFTHSEAMSLSVSCRDARQVDYYSSRLTANGGGEGPRGWLKDRFGVSWQVVPEGLGALIPALDPGRRSRALQAMLKMKKLDLAAMRAAAGDR